MHVRISRRGFAYLTLAMFARIRRVSTVRTPPVAIGADELTRRFGPGPRGVVWPVPEHRPDEGIWLLLPIGYGFAALAMLVLVQRLRSAGVIIVLFRW